jgi:hypothetical protein
VDVIKGFIIKADGKGGRLFGDVTVDGTALESGKKVSEIRIGGGCSAFDLCQSICMEGASLSCNFRTF